MTAPPVLSVVLPTFNERGTIGRLGGSIQSARGSTPHEMLVMDVQSPDGTAAAARAAAGRDDRVQVVERVPPAGLTVSLLDGVRRARGHWVAWMDCDFSHPPELLPELLSAVSGGAADIACASRYVPGGRDERDSTTARAMSLVINGLARWLVDRRVRDYTTGYLVAPRQLVLDLGLTGDYGEYCIALLARAVRTGHSVAELPYRSVPRRSGSSKTATSLAGFARRGWPYLKTIASLATESRR
jgi:dolichol-phosphate mannosyltransferase